MNQKTVYQLDFEGFLLYPTVADESPLEPGIFLIPAGCVDVEPLPPAPGKRQRFVDGAFVYVDVPPDQPLPPGVPPTLEHLRVAKINEIKLEAEWTAAQLTEGYPDFEMKTWPAQEAEALAWDADNTVPTPRIDAMAGYRGMDRVEYLQRTLAKVLYFQKVSDYLVGTRQKYVDQAKAAESAEDLDAIVPVYELPRNE